jgi:hypothetical protein
MARVWFAQVRFGGRGSLKADTEHRNKLKTRVLASEEFDLQKLVAAGILSAPLAAVIADCIRDGVRRGAGRSGAYLPPVERRARDEAMKALPALYRRRLAEAKGAYRNPRQVAHKRAAEDVRQLMRKLGAKRLPAVTTIIKKWKFHT